MKVISQSTKIYILALYFFQCAQMRFPSTMGRSKGGAASRRMRVYLYLRRNVPGDVSLPLLSFRDLVARFLARSPQPKNADEILGLSMCAMLFMGQNTQLIASSPSVS